MIRLAFVERVMACIGDGLDEFFTGRWWWRVARVRAEARLKNSLEQQGDVSMAAREATEHVRRIDFAFDYWRPAPGPVMRVVRDAEHKGVLIKDLQLLVFNGDVRLHRGQVEVRRSILMRVISFLAQLLITVHWSLLCAFALTGPGALWLKAVVVAVISVIYSVLYRGWTLCTSRSIRAVKRSGDAVEALCKPLQTAKVLGSLRGR